MGPLWTHHDGALRTALRARLKARGTFPWIGCRRFFDWPSLRTNGFRMKSHCQSRTSRSSIQSWEMFPGTPSTPWTPPQAYAFGHLRCTRPRGHRGPVGGPHISSLSCWGSLKDPPTAHDWGVSVLTFWVPCTSPIIGCGTRKEEM